jgi:hypothetical protein
MAQKDAWFQLTQSLANEAHVSPAEAGHTKPQSRWRITAETAFSVKSSAAALRIKEEETMVANCEGQTGW